jgi:hypothetical protein
MLKLELPSLFAAHNCLSSLRQTLHFANNRGMQGRMSVASWHEVLAEGNSMASMCEEAGLTVPARAAREMVKIIAKAEVADNVVTISHDLGEEIEQQGDYLVRSFKDALEDQTFFRLSPNEARFYHPDALLFGEQVAVSFPSASFDIDEAGKCRALSRWTACVVHLMRALDVALHVFQDHMQVKVPKENWQDVINQIEAKIKANGPKHPDQQWASEAATHFRHLKDAWRNYAVHGKDAYDEERAVTIYDSTRAFMRQLAARVSE